MQKAVTHLHLAISTKRPGLQPDKERNAHPALYDTAPIARIGDRFAEDVIANPASSTQRRRLQAVPTTQGSLSASDGAASRLQPDRRESFTAATHLTPRLRLNFIGEADDESVMVWHSHLWQRLGVHRVRLTYKSVFRQDECGQRIHFVVG